MQDTADKQSSFLPAYAYLDPAGAQSGDHHAESYSDGAGSNARVDFASKSALVGGAVEQRLGVVEGAQSAAKNVGTDTARVGNHR